MFLCVCVRNTRYFIMFFNFFPLNVLYHIYMNVPILFQSTRKIFLILIKLNYIKCVELKPLILKRKRRGRFIIINANSLSYLTFLFFICHVVYICNSKNLVKANVYTINFAQDLTPFFSHFSDVYWSY